MAVEQVVDKGRALGPAVDIYALGAILYELLCGRPPFVGVSIESTLAIVAKEDPIPPRRLQPDVPRDLETICLKCLEKDPARRYSSAAALADDLGRFGNGEPVLARAPSNLDRLVKLARRHLAFVVGVAGVIAALALGFATTGVMAARESRARRLADGHARLAEAARTSALRQTYQARLAAAIAAMGTHDIREAARQLDLAPSELRGWEWRHLHASPGCLGSETSSSAPRANGSPLPTGADTRFSTPSADSAWPSAQPMLPATNCFPSRRVRGCDSPRIARPSGLRST
jgi:hypothetical protein